MIVNIIDLKMISLVNVRVIYSYIPILLNCHQREDIARGSGPVDCNVHMKLTWKPTRARECSDRFNSFITHQMAHISQMRVKYIHLVVVSEDSAHWDPLVKQLEQLTGGCALTILEYLYSLLSCSYRSSSSSSENCEN